MTDQIAGVCPVCNEKVMRPWRYEAQAFGRQTLIHFSCLAVWRRVIGAWHTELADGSSEPQAVADELVSLRHDVANLRAERDTLRSAILEHTRRDMGKFKFPLKDIEGT